FVPDGVQLPEAKGGVEWLDRDTLLLSSAFGDGMATASGYARTVRLWRRGADPAAAPVLFEVAPQSMVAWGGLDRTQPTETVWYVERPGFFDLTLSIGARTGPKGKLHLPTDLAIEAHRAW